ncbi:hypothetical protein [Rhizobium sp. CECT 9324]|uniref:hypothetical protein n=1 Tax=Rhizobium sp. CECT 9324 TaxID=2845820 RepID=UPI001E383CBE|nr:hypothetical protein [Rhizobium sp. CECT 9324]CAH0342323.1 hypothetical protein RHI9324_04046 [Rhizobium sp. CECT 9324]CAH0343764.1 hypothetical protein RHI9324_05502 [Rhizobium sp. CECT 9324]
MSDNLKYVRQLLKDATDAGFTLVCTYGHGEDPDYTGTDTKLALEALTACDEMYLLIKRDGNTVSRAFIIPDVVSDPEEVIADYAGGWMDAWCNANVREAAI